MNKNFSIDYNKYYTISKNIGEVNVSGDVDSIKNNNLAEVRIVGAFSTKENAEKAKNVLFPDRETTMQKDEDGLVFENIKTVYTIGSDEYPGYELIDGSKVAIIDGNTYRVDALMQRVAELEGNQPGNQ